MVMTIAAALLGVSAQGIRKFSRQQKNERLARSIMFEVTMARSYAIRAGIPLALVADETNKELILRDGFGNVYRTSKYNSLSPLSATTLDIQAAGDSIVFSPRGFCLNCASTGTTISLGTGQRTSSMTVLPLGRVELVGFSRTG